MALKRRLFSLCAIALMLSIALSTAGQTAGPANMPDLPDSPREQSARGDSVSSAFRVILPDYPVGTREQRATLPYHPKAALALNVLSSAMTVVDVEYTQSCLRSHACTERDPIYGRSPSRLRMYATNVPINLGASYFSSRLRAKHSRFWWTPQVAVIGMHAWGTVLTAKYLGRL